MSFWSLIILIDKSDYLFNIRHNIIKDAIRGRLESPYINKSRIIDMATKEVYQLQESKNAYNLNKHLHQILRWYCSDVLSLHTFPLWNLLFETFISFLFFNLQGLHFPLALKKVPLLPFSISWNFQRLMQLKRYQIYDFQK